jgi:glycosyltransferase involved in cell wall biosynthesis
MRERSIEEFRKRRIVFVVASPLTVSAFLKPHINALKEFAEVHVIVDSSTSSRDLEQELGVQVWHVEILREPRLSSDIAALIRLRSILRRIRPDVVQTVTPKAGLLGMFVSWISCVPVRVHWVTGQIWFEMDGFQRIFYRALDRLTHLLSTALLVDSISQLNYLLSTGFISSSKASVIGNGSISGVDTQRFRPDEPKRLRLRNALDIPPNAVVLCFVGRVKVEKGFKHLVEAVDELRTHHSVVLLVVGSDEDGLIEGARTVLQERLIFIGQSDAVEDFLCCSDVFVLPSFREGFGLSVIEASSSGLPVVVSDIYGLADSFVNEVTGIQVPVKSSRELSKSLERLVLAPDYRRKLGNAGRERVKREFSRDFVVEQYCAFISTISMNP